MSRLTAILSSLVFGFVITSGAVATPITIIGVSAPTVGDGLGISSDEFLQVSWSQTGSYTGVKISALLFGGIVTTGAFPCLSPQPSVLVAWQATASDPMPVVES